jgi:hypothetical protein
VGGDEVFQLAQGLGELLVRLRAGLAEEAGEVEQEGEETLHP